MIEKDIIGGVTPLKVRTSKTKAGTVGKQATKYNPGSGFSISDTVDTGKGYRANLESLTQGTRLTSSLADTLKTQTTPKTKKPTTEFGEVPEVTIEDILGTDERQVKSTEKYVYEDYKPFWDSRIDDPDKWSPGMKSFLKDVDLNDPDAVKAAYDKWYKVSSDPKNVAARKKSREERVSTSGYTEYRDYKMVDGKKEYTTDWYRK
jgi:hypothetical protein